MQPTRPTTVVLADGHAIVREGLAALCAVGGIEVLAQCRDDAEAIESIEKLHPDFAILDLRPPGIGNAEIIRRLRESGSRVILIVLSAVRSEDAVMEALRAGADAYLLKDGPWRHVAEALSYVRDGGVYLSPLLGGAAFFVKAEGGRPAGPLAALSHRETQVLRQLVKGMRAKEIAEALDISPKTVDTYRASLMRKLEVRDVVGLVRFAISHNLISAKPEDESE
jgi:DNA-binding NarL/FixJ family response regulator